MSNFVLRIQSGLALSVTIPIGDLNTPGGNTNDGVVTLCC
jgi:hypothetical protein